MTPQKLFAVYLGGRADKCNIELHDVIFVSANSIQDSYPKIIDLWFGSKEHVHIDSWIELTQIENYQVELVNEKPNSNEHLYFINLGAYKDGLFTEVHESMFVAANNKIEAKKAAKAKLCLGLKTVHTDDLYEVDDCIEVQLGNNQFIKLTPDPTAKTPTPNNGYHKIPR